MGHNVGNDLSDAIIGLIGTRGPLSRASIARQLGVSPASITHLTRSLIEEGVLREAGTDASSGGRPATLLDLNDRRRYALGVKITPNHLAVTEVEMNKEQGPSTSLDLDMRSPDTLDQITQAVAQAARSHQDELMGVGLAIPGFSKPQDPDIVTAPILGWNQVDLGRLVRERTGLPVIIDNDVNALLLAHRLYSPQPTGDDLLITIGIGIGAAFTSQGQIIHGGRGGAGELGHTMITESDVPCSCGLSGCLEALIGDDGLVRQARKAGLLTATQGKDHLNALALSGNEAARSVFYHAALLLGRAAANLVHLLDPDTVTISGEGVDVWPLWEAGFSHGFRSRLPIHRRDIPVTVQPWSEDTWAYGAASLVFASPIVGRRAS